jgi:uncharacterized membrane protein YeaQ/YmgE (transglycosylase-associated protein family)
MIGHCKTGASARNPRASWRKACSPKSNTGGGEFDRSRTQEAEVTMMGIVFFLWFGLFAGLLAWLVVARKTRDALVTIVAVGVTGSFLGDGLLSYMVGEHLQSLNRSGVVGSVAGAVCLLFVACGILQDIARPRDDRRRRRETGRALLSAADCHTRALSPCPSPLFVPDRQSPAKDGA